MVFWFIVAPDVVKDVKAVVPPTAPNDTVPPVPPVRDSVFAPLTVLDSVMFAPAAVTPAFVASKTAFPA